METTQYTTIEGERWDTVSFKMYGVPNEIHRLIEANPNIPYCERLKGGLVLEIPILETNNLITDKENLPPWKR